ncbi:MAG TPA: hypothetical protein VNZ52_06645, partial [Candidatus Thermoplasmatota archaeon]|nr:hypothetical protein [Candidatus Thermoplasmatota archaeon]
FMIQQIQQVSDEGDALLHFLVGEHISVTKYSDCLKSAGFLPEEVVSVLTQGALDESRHFNWAWEELQRFDIDVDLGVFADLHEEIEGLLGGANQ